MALAARRPCTYPGCGVLTETGRCEKHAYTVKREHDARRGNSTQRGYDRHWQKESKAFLLEHPLCQCEQCEEGRIRVLPANVVDHKIPHRGNKVLFWDRTNWQAMNKQCHDRKTAAEDGGFGRAGSKG